MLNSIYTVIVPNSPLSDFWIRGEIIYTTQEMLEYFADVCVGTIVLDKYGASVHAYSKSNFCYSFQKARLAKKS